MHGFGQKAELAGNIFLFRLPENSQPQLKNTSYLLEVSKKSFNDNSDYKIYSTKAFCTTYWADEERNEIQFYKILISEMLWEASRVP